MLPTVPEIIAVAEDGAFFEVQQSHHCLIEDPRNVARRILRQDLDIAITQATDAKFIQMIVLPVECGLKSEMEMLQVPMNRWDQASPYGPLDPVYRNSDLHGVCALNIA